MIKLCLKAKLGYCKYGRNKCDKIHVTELCDKNENCKEKYCDKRHPRMCRYYEEYKICKYGSYCAYSHSVKPTT